MKTTITLEFSNDKKLDEFMKKLSLLKQEEKEGVYLVMKDGHEGEKPTMDNIRGICIPDMDGSRFLLYPKYVKFPLLPKDKIKDYKGKCYTEVEALYTKDNKETTSELLALGSEAAKFVREFGMDLPTLSMCFAIEHYREEINAISEKIEGADLIKDSYRWSCCRYSTSYAWYYGGNGVSYLSSFYDGLSVSAVSAL